MIVDKTYGITSRGCKIAKRINPSGRDELLDYLYKNKKGTCTIDELSGILDLTTNQTRSILAQHISSGTVQEF
jgi:Fic family protein